jgi:hypothetical protein
VLEAGSTRKVGRHTHVWEAVREGDGTTGIHCLLGKTVFDPTRARFTGALPLQRATFSRSVRLGEKLRRTAAKSRTLQS